MMRRSIAPVRSPYVRAKTVPAQPSIVDFGQAYAQIQDAIKRMTAKEALLDKKLSLADQTISTAQDRLTDAHKQVGRITEVFDGIRYAKGKDGRDGADGVDADEDSVADRVMANIRQPKDGDTPMIDYAAIVEEVSQRIKQPEDGKDAELDYEKLVERLEKELGIGDKIDSSVRQRMAWVQAGQHGGGTTVSPGTNITLVPNPDGTTTINATGGGGKFIYNEEVAGSGTAWTLAHSPINNSLQLFANGQRLMPTVDYSVSGDVITTVLSWDTGTLLADYQY